MEHNQQTNAAYIPREDYYDGGGYLGYGGHNDMEGCRRLFFTVLVIILAAIAGGVLAIVL
jgi:hypothetical protein